MEKPLKGDVVVIPFPYTNLLNSKNRPALVVANLVGDDLILCQITSQQRIDNYSIMLIDTDFNYGELNVSSIIRPNLLFTVDKSIVKYVIGRIKNNKMKEVENKLIAIIEG